MNTHYFAASVADHAELKRKLERADINAVLYLCEEDWFGLGLWDERPQDERWLILDTRSENWTKLPELIDKLFEVWDYASQSWEFRVAWQDRELGARFWAPHLDEESTVLTAEQLDALARFFGRQQHSIERLLNYDMFPEFLYGVGIPYIEALDQDIGHDELERKYPEGYVLYAHEMEGWEA
jgi:hypothetical protein